MSKKSKRIRAKLQVSPKSTQPLIHLNEKIQQPALQNIKVSSVVHDSQYNYVIPEMIRISIIAGIFFIVLIILSFVFK